MNRNEIRWQQLLDEAVNKPGSILAAYSQFHQYSMGNSMLALLQCQQRGIQPGPMAPYSRWKELGRYVKRGEKALTLCMPIKVKDKSEEREKDQEKFRTVFVYKNRWFVLAQTDGEEYTPEPIPDWDKVRALETLEIQEEPFNSTDGNTQGYATDGKIAINPLAELPHKTLFHELAHQVLGHAAEGEMSDTEHVSRNLKEAEAEAVALLCCEALSLEGAEYCRGYIQSWIKGAEIPERSAQRIFHAADQILRAGRSSEN